MEGGDAFARAVQLMQECALLDNGSGVGALALTFRAPSFDDVGSDEWEEEEEMEDLLMGAEDAVADSSLWAQVEPGCAPPLEVETENGYMVQFSSKDLHTKLMENVDRRYAFSFLLISLYCELLLSEVVVANDVVIEKIL